MKRKFTHNTIAPPNDAISDSTMLWIVPEGVGQKLSKAQIPSVSFFYADMPNRMLSVLLSTIEQFDVKARRGGNGE